MVLLHQPVLSSQLTITLNSPYSSAEQVQQRHGEGSMDQLFNLATRPLSGMQGLVTSSFNSVGALASTIGGSSTSTSEDAAKATTARPRPHQPGDSTAIASLPEASPS
jgi:hypothetical protein